MKSRIHRQSCDSSRSRFCGGRAGRGAPAGVCIMGEPSGSSSAGTKNLVLLIHTNSSGHAEQPGLRSNAIGDVGTLLDSRSLWTVYSLIPLCHPYLVPDSETKAVSGLTNLGFSSAC